MKNLEKFRSKIDLIDNNILKLLKSRSKLALEIGKLKKVGKINFNLFRPERQAKILKRLYLKRDILFNEKDILSFWREIFFHQTRLQGKLDFIIPSFLNKRDRRMVFNLFGIDIIINEYNNLEKAFLKTKNNNNSLLILPFPGKTKRSMWWSNSKLKNLYITSSVPTLLDLNLNPELVVLSNQMPILEGENILYYFSTQEFLNEELDLVIAIKNKYLYSSKLLVKKKKLKFLGAYPTPYIKKKYEKDK